MPCNWKAAKKETDLSTNRKSTPPDGGAFSSQAAVLDTVEHLGFFRVIEPVERADEVAGDTADALKFDALAHDAVMLMQSRLHFAPP